MTHIYISDYMPWNLKFKSGLSAWTVKDFKAPGRLEVLKVAAGRITYGEFEAELKGGTVNYIGDIRFEVQGLMRGAVSTMIVDNEVTTMAEAKAAIPALLNTYGYEKHLLHTDLASPDEPIQLVTTSGKSRSITAPSVPDGCDVIAYRTAFRQSYTFAFNDAVKQVIWEGTGITEKLEAERLATPLAPYQPVSATADERRCFDAASAAGKQSGETDARNLPAANPHANGS